MLNENVQHGEFVKVLGEGFGGWFRFPGRASLAAVVVVSLLSTMGCGPEDDVDWGGDLGGNAGRLQESTDLRSTMNMVCNFCRDSGRSGKQRPPVTCEFPTQWFVHGVRLVWMSCSYVYDNPKPVQFRVEIRQLTAPFYQDTFCPGKQPAGSNVVAMDFGRPGLGVWQVRVLASAGSGPVQEVARGTFRVFPAGMVAMLSTAGQVFHDINDAIPLMRLVRAG